ncbi:MAG TPA: hypothetical protein VMU47_03480 [Caldimonas sp.]|nr:hypothetical protein [Caldimonas sp.]
MIPAARRRIAVARRSITDRTTAFRAIAAAALLWRFTKLPQPVVVLAAALIGLVVHPLVSPA